MMYVQDIHQVFHRMIFLCQKMKNMKKIAILCLTAVILSNCTAPQSNATESNITDNENMNEWPDGVCYEIFIQSFADSNGDGIGDLPGATSKLDYLQDLGIRAVWLMPIMASPSYHKYDVTDYKQIHPDYGTMDDFKTFVAEAHKRNIKVVIDMIINHSSSEHPWFKEALKGPDNPYREYYVWANKDSIADQIAKKEVTHDSDNITQWHAVDGDKSAAHYYGFFYGGMPDLNFDSDKLKKEIVDIGKWWLTEVGVDGFRLDAAKHIFPDERLKDSYNWWAFYRDEMRKAKPDVYLVGEVWASSDVVVNFVNGFPALFNFDLAGSINQTVINETSQASTIVGPKWEVVEGKSMVDGFTENTKKYQAINADFSDAIFLSNHDQNRIMSNVGGNMNKAKLAASILLTLPGSPYIYYGEEIGMTGKKPDENIREPFLWSPEDDDSQRTKWMTAEYSVDQSVTPASIQMTDPNSLYSHYKKLISDRNESEILRDGVLEVIPEKNLKILAYKRILGDQSISIYHNLSGVNVTIDDNEIPAYGTLTLK